MVLSGLSAKANEQKSILLKSQVLEAGDVNTSASMLAVIAVQNPKSTDKVLSAAVEMDKFLNTHYANAHDKSFQVEKLAIPALMEAMQQKAQKNAKSSFLLAKSMHITSRVKCTLAKEDDPTMRNVYDRYFSSFSQILSPKNTEFINSKSLQKTMYEI